jgi:hypothetical protein
MIGSLVVSVRLLVRRWTSGIRGVLFRSSLFA